MLLGLQLESVVDQVGEGEVGRLAAIGVALAAIVIAVRVVFAALPLAPGLSRRERLVVGWCGMRGAISLAAALSIATDIPGRSEVIFLTFVVILVTLVGQGLTLPALIKTLKLPSEREWSPEEAVARLEAAQTALDRLDELEEDDRISEEALRRLRDALPGPLPAVHGHPRRREGPGCVRRSSGCATATSAATSSRPSAPRS